jgi:threonine synthase
VKIQTSATIRDYFKGKACGSYVVDPHTAVGLTAGNRIAETTCAPSHLALMRSYSDVLATRPPSFAQIALSTAHPAKFSSAVSEALHEVPTFNFDRDVLPDEFRGLLEKKRRVIYVKGTDIKYTKAVVEKEVERLFGKQG